VSYASAREVDSHLQVLFNTGAIDPRLTDQARCLFNEVRAMTWRLLHPKAVGVVGGGELLERVFSASRVVHGEA
jgi:hypothetical protein